LAPHPLRVIEAAVSPPPPFTISLGLSTEVFFYQPASNVPPFGLIVREQPHVVVESAVAWMGCALCSTSKLEHNLVRGGQELAGTIRNTCIYWFRPPTGAVRRCHSVPVGG
jgi:hypothetical protein